MHLNSHRLTALFVSPCSLPPAQPSNPLSLPLAIPASTNTGPRALLSLPTISANSRATATPNAALKPPAAGENRVVFFGDSITDIWKLEDYFPGKPYLNRGIGGQTTPQMLVRFRQDVIDLHPKAVVILAGTNDIAGNTGPHASRRH